MTVRESSRRDVLRALGAVALLPFPARAASTRPLTIGLYQSVAGFEIGTVKSMSQATISLSMAVMEGLFSLDFENGSTIVSRLAVSYKPDADHRNAIIRLRPHVRFHDGTPLDANAVAFHYNRILDPALGLGFHSTFLEPLIRVEVVDVLTVRFVLKQPWYGLQTTLAIYHPMNLIGSPSALAADAAAFNRHPVGTGPFIFEEWRTDDRITLRRNPYYRESDVPRTDDVVFRFIPDESRRR
jgi:peptide/nickel transport system substrate-binding protein